MIRLTELEKDDETVAVKIEGYLTHASLQVLDEALVQYARQNARQVHLWADGLLAVDTRALEEHKRHFPPQLSLVFHTSRIALQHLLRSGGFEVVLQDPPPDRGGI